MCPSVVVILLVRTQDMAQVSLANYDHVIQAFASDGADQSFRVTVLPRRSWCRRSVANPQRANAARKCLAVDTVAIMNEVIRHRFPPAGLADLSGDPVGGWRWCDADPRIRLRSCRRIRRPYSNLNEIVGTTKRSIEATHPDG